MLAILILCGASLTREVSLPEPVVFPSSLPGFSTVAIPGFRRASLPGYPLLPLVPVVFAFRGEPGQVSVRLDQVRSVALGLPVEPASQPGPIGFPEARSPVPAPEVYGSPDDYPSDPLAGTHSGRLMGFTVFSCLVNPWRYNPLEGRLELAGEVSVTLEYLEEAPSTALSPLQSQVAGRRTAELAGEDVPPGPLGVQGAAEYLLITGDGYLPLMQPLLDAHARRGLTVKALGMSQVAMAYGGVRECIRWHYLNEGTVFVLLGGDASVVPAEEILVGCTDENLWEYAPVDLYYACLDGDWDGDGDGVPGQPQDDPDLYPEVILGRALFRTETGAAAFVDKTVTYLDDPPQGGWASTAVLNGGMLFPDIGYTGAKGCEAMAVHFPDDWEIVRSYEFGVGDYPDTFFEPIAAGSGWNHYAGHGNNRGVYWATFNSQIKVADQNLLNNGRRTGIHTSIACHPGDFTRSGVCLAEMLLHHPDGGGVAAAMNTSWGWEGFWPELGPSEDMCTDMVRLVFDEGTPTLGEAVTGCRDLQVPLVSGGYDRTFQSLLVYTAFMDPALEVLRTPSTPPPPPEPVLRVSLGGPNPVFHGEAVFDVDFTQGPVTLRIFDMAGRLIFSSAVQEPGTVTWDCSGMPAGVYTAVARRGGYAGRARVTVLRP